VSASSTTLAGKVELATTAETETGTDATRAVTPDGLHDMTTLAGAAWFLDEDNFASNSDTKVASQQSTKAYITTAIAAVGAALRYSQDVGDNSSTAIVVTHGLGTRDLVCSVRLATTPWDVQMCDVEFTSTTTATLRFAVAPTTNQLRVTFVG